MNYRLAHNVELVERDGELFLMSRNSSLRPAPEPLSG